jgi:hypothetical protein
MQAANYADEVVTIADDASNDWMDVETKAGRIVRTFDHEHVQRSRLRIDTRTWLMARYAPQQFGERKQLEVTTRDAEFARLDGLTDAERLAEARELIETARRRLAMAQWTGQLGGGSEAASEKVP